jgi:hypothetical protein
MTTLRRTVGRTARTLLFTACVLLSFPTVAFAQEASPAPDTGPDVWGNMPGAVLLLVPIVIGGALYISRRLGPRDDDATSNRREGAVSKALARQAARETPAGNAS